MSPVSYGWSSDVASLCGTDPPWDTEQSNNTNEPSLNEALNWFALPATPLALGSQLHNTGLLHDDINAPSVLQTDRLDAAWNVPSTSPMESAVESISSGLDSQAAPAASDSFFDLPSPSDDGSKQQGGTHSRYTTERKLLKNREAQRRFRQRHKVVLCSLHRFRVFNMPVTAWSMSNMQRQVHF